MNNKRHHHKLQTPVHRWHWFIAALLLIFTFTSATSFAINSYHCPIHSSNQDASHLKSTTEVAQELVEKGLLLNQSSPELDRKGLLVEGGGLCVSTCGENLMHIFTQRIQANSSIFIDHPGTVVEKFYKEAQQGGFNMDIRKGAYLHTVAFELSAVAKHFGLPFRVENIILPSDSYPFAGYELHEIAPGPNELTLGAINMGPDPETGQDMRHAILIIDIDISQERISFIDPNHPDKVIKAIYATSPPPESLKDNPRFGQRITHIKYGYQNSETWSSLEDLFKLHQRL